MAIHSFWDERKLLVLVALIILSAGAMLVEISAARAGSQSFIDQAISFVVTPIQGAITGSTRAAANELDALVHAPALAARNAELDRENHVLRAANDLHMSAATENAELRRLLHLQQTTATRSVAATVVGYAPEASRKLIIIDRGWRDGITRDCVVINADGLVGHVIDLSLHESRVLLIIDPTNAVPAYLQRTRSWGVVLGTWQHAKMKYIAQDVQIREGDEAVTGRGEVYPPDIPIGRVREVDRKENALYQTAVLDPVVDFDSLTHVLVLLRS